jgi:hypothetical protein
MALTKLPRNAIGTGAIDNTKIEDGTIQAVELSGTLPETKLATSTIANAKLSNSTISVRGTSRALGDSFSLQVDVDWQSIQTGDFTASAGRGYFVNTTSQAIEVTLPASASIGDTIAIKDYAGTFATNNLTIARNGHNIQGVANNSLISTNRASLVLVYVDATKGWLFTDEHNVADLGQALFTSATGGTVATSGDFKIHSFTGDADFVVSQVGNIIGGPGNVDYLVIAGGGAGSGGGHGGGGGAGGFRTTFPSPTCNAGTFPISVQTYPITVGAAGASPGACGQKGVPGSVSTFSTITSAGGGAGVGNPGYSPSCASGGSGGGGAGPGPSGGTGNTPPVSPPQGNNGGSGVYAGPRYGTGGGGGAGAVGGNGSSSAAGNGGVGLANSISASSVTYAGGGGGSSWDSGPQGTGGSGGGGAGSGGGTGGTGTANTGGGGGGASRSACTSPTCAVGGSGGSGIVIIRYKFQ